MWNFGIVTTFTCLVLFERHFHWKRPPSKKLGKYRKQHYNSVLQTPIESPKQKKTKSKLNVHSCEGSMSGIGITIILFSCVFVSGEFETRQTRFYVSRWSKRCCESQGVFSSGNLIAKLHLGLPHIHWIDKLSSVFDLVSCTYFYFGVVPIPSTFKDAIFMVPHTNGLSNHMFFPNHVESR